jgi:hypothetical protein
MSDAFTILDGVDAIELSASLSGDRVSISPEALEASLGWTLEDAGLCRGDVCVPIRDRSKLVVDGEIDLAEFAAAMERPIVIDTDESSAALGTPARQRADAMAGLEAPDFSLPDLAGNLHKLSDHRGKKVLLIAYASW